MANGTTLAALQGSNLKLRNANEDLRAQLSQVKKDLSASVSQAKNLGNSALELGGKVRNLVDEKVNANSRITVASTIMLSATVGAGVSLGGIALMRYLAKPADGKPPGTMYKYLKWFEALPAAGFGALTTTAAIYMAGDASKSYGVTDQMVRQLAAAFDAIALVKGGEAAIWSIPTGNLPGRPQ